MAPSAMNNAPNSISDRLDNERQMLIRSFLEDRGPGFLKAHTRILDDFFIAGFENSLAGPKLNMIRNPYAIIALGGYGRREQCIASDIDLMFLFKHSVPQNAESLIREVIYPLWDLGFEVGYATRGLDECIRIAGEDYEVLTSLLDARFLCGQSLLYSELMEKLRAKLLARKTNPIINWLVERNLERHQVFGDSSYRLEPNLKEGQGGLRDYHTMLWIGRIKFDYKDPRDFEYFGHLSNAEYGEFRAALSFIWNVRSRLHHHTGRKCDQMHLEYQERLAVNIGFTAAEGQKPVERFLGALQGRMELIKHRYLVYLYELGYPKKRGMGKKKIKVSETEGIRVQKEALYFAGPENILQSPILLIKIFEESARLKLPLSAEALRLVKEFGYLADENYRRNSTVVRSFERILRAPVPVFNVLNAMLGTGFLVRIVPDFRHLVNRIQYNQYHLYAVDKHSLRTVLMLKRFGTSDEAHLDPLCRKLYRDLKNRKRLLWAALLHDIGKGATSHKHSLKGAEIARRLLTEMGYGPKLVEGVAGLVADHLILVITATRRDLNDEQTAIVCARRIKTIEHLKMLYLLTVADSMATGPKAWNDWTAVLLRELFLKVLNILERGELASEEAVQLIESKRQDILHNLPVPRDKAYVKSLFRFMSPRYMLYMPARLVGEHIELYRQLGDRDFVWDIRRGETRTVIICAKDRPGLFAKIAGVLTLNGMDILDAQIFTWRNNIALDIFEVKPPPDLIFEDEKWQRAQQHLTDALADRLDIAAALEKRLKAYKPRKPRIVPPPNQVQVDNDSSSFFTIIEVYTNDFMGLLFRITHALFSCDLDIWIAKIATKIDQVVDVFYVRDLTGQKVTDPKRLAHIKSTILAALPDFKTLTN